MKETFTRNKVLSVLVLILLLTNILLLVFFVRMKPSGAAPGKMERDDRDKGGVTQLLEKQVGFTPDQMAQYKTLREQHWDKMKPYFGEMRTAKDRFYRLLSTSVAGDSLAVSAAADSIAAKQKQIDMQTFRHFRQVRNICTPAQQPAFDSMVQQVIRRMNGPWKKNTSKEKNDSSKTHH